MTTRTPRRYDAVVVGGGVIGCASAAALAARDRDVLVLDRDALAGGATGLSAGLVAPALFYPDAPRLAAHAFDGIAALDGTGNFTFTRRTRYEFVGPDAAADARATADDLAAAGHPVRFRDRASLREALPRFRLDRFAGAVEYADAGWVDPHTLTTALASRAAADGATVETGETVTGLLTDGDEVTGVRTRDGRYRADAVVVAAGWRTRSLLADHVSLPVCPYRTQCVVLDPGFDASGFPLGRLPGEELYFRPEHRGTLLVGGGSAVVDDPRRASGGADEAFRDAVARTVPAVVEGFDDARVVEGWAGVDAATPDGRPVVDAPAGAPDGLVVATGLNGLGVMTAPAVASAVAAHVAGADVPFDPAVFSLDRFDDATTDFALHSTFDTRH